MSLRSAPSATDSEPYQVLVAAAGNSFDFGAGLPLTRRHVLTTATLVRGYVSWNIGYGSSQFNRLQYIESSIAYMHPNFNGNTMNDNLGIIVLPTALPRGLLRPIRMPTESEAATFPRLNQEGRLVGFGLVKESNNTKLAPNSVLKTVYLTVGADCAKHFPNTHTGKNFCASDDHPESMNLCRGDVGDAFVVTRRGENVLVSEEKEEFFGCVVFVCQ